MKRVKTAEGAATADDLSAACVQHSSKSVEYVNTRSSKSIEDLETLLKKQ